MPIEIPPAVNTLLQSGARCFVVPMEPQPPEGYIPWYTLPDYDDNGSVVGYCQGWTRDAFQGEKGNPFEERMPLWPGTVLPVKEEWRPVMQQCGTGMYGVDSVCGLVEYRADAGNLLATKVAFPMGECPRVWSSIWWGRDMPDDGWHPADSMPDWLARRHVVVTDCRPVKIGSIGHKEWCDWFKPSYVDRERALASFTGWEYQKKWLADWYASHFPGTTLESWGWLVTVEPKGESHGK